MFSFVGGDAWPWRNQLTVVTSTYFRGDVKTSFEAGAAWARTERIPFPDRDHLGLYLSSLQKRYRQPYIPEFMRRFIAHMLGITVADHHVKEVKLKSRNDEYRQDSIPSPQLTISSVPRGMPPKFVRRPPQMLHLQQLH